jgi:HSP20 family molecular chaperone IbpA
MGEPKSIIHIRIRDLRRGRSLTQEELAAALGVSRQSVNAMEAGRCLPSLPVALELASFFAVPIHQLLDEAHAVAQAQAQAQSHTSEVVRFQPFEQAFPELSGSVAANIAHTPRELLVELSLPGYRKDDISLDVGEDFIAVEGESLEIHDEAQYIQREFVVSGFSRTLQLPVPVEPDTAEADMRNGILSIRLKKRLAERPKTSRIQIRE